MNLMETLENRQLFAGNGNGDDGMEFELTTNGALNIRGTAAADEIHIVVINNKVLVEESEQFGDEWGYITLFKTKAFKVKRLVFDGRSGNDIVVIASDIHFNTTLRGGEGNDELWAGSGNDLVKGEEGDDIMKGLRGRDTMNGNGGDDAINGGRGNDELTGGEGTDQIGGGSGDDTIYSQDGQCNDFIWGQGGDDTAYADVDDFDAPEGIPLELADLENLIGTPVRD